MTSTEINSHNNLHQMVNQLSKTAELLIGVLRAQGSQPADLIEVLDVQQQTITELRRVLHLTNIELNELKTKPIVAALMPNPIQKS